MINIKAKINDNNTADVDCSITGSVDEILMELRTLFAGMLAKQPEIFHAVLMQFDLVDSFDKCNKDDISVIDLRLSKMEDFKYDT